MRIKMQLLIDARFVNVSYLLYTVCMLYIHAYIHSYIQLDTQTVQGQFSFSRKSQCVYKINTNVEENTN